MHQMVGKGADRSSVLQLLGDNPKDDKNWPFVVDGTKECPFDGGYVSCWSMLPWLDVVHRNYSTNLHVLSLIVGILSIRWLMRWREKGADRSYVQLLSSTSKDEKKSPPEVNGMKDCLFNGGLVSGCNWSLFPWLPLVNLDDRKKLIYLSLVGIIFIRLRKKRLIVVVFSSSAMTPKMAKSGRV
jgi:hypothetical protein